MEIRRTPKRTQRKIKQGDLLGVWLDLLNHLDNPTRRRAAKLREALRSRRDFSGRRAGEVIHFRNLQVVRTYRP
jgi:hypothetical protein